MKGLDNTLFSGDKSFSVGYYLHFIRVYQNGEECRWSLQQQEDQVGSLYITRLKTSEEHDAIL